LVFVSALLLSLSLSTIVRSLSEIPNSDEIVVAYMWEPYTVDPHLAYDTASAELIFNVYGALCKFDHDLVDSFVPEIAESWPGSDNSKRIIMPSSPDPAAPEHTNQTWYFRIREGIRWQPDPDHPENPHYWGNVTTEDVEYSFERAMVMDSSDGPTWIFYEPLTNRSNSQQWDLSDPVEVAELGKRIDNVIQCNSTHVWFNLVSGYAPFQQILCESWSSILCRGWAISHGCWNASWHVNPSDYTSWIAYNNPEEPGPLMTPAPEMLGSGPYMLDYWEQGAEWSIIKFDEYWQGWSSHSHVSRATVKMVYSWSMMFDGFTTGQYDIIPVPLKYISEVEGQPGIRCVKDLPILGCTAFFFNFNVSITSPYLGSGFDLAYPYVIAEDRIPINFFSDIHVRKGFAHCFNYTRYIEDYDGGATQPATPVLKGLPYHNPAQKKYSLDLAQAEQEFRLAWDGQVWDTGFTFMVAYVTGGYPPIGMWPQILKANVESLNEKFHVNLVEIVGWYPFVELFQDRELTFSNPMGWFADYPDPHNFIYEFMHANGCFACYQSYSNVTVDALVEEGLNTVNTTRRHQVYYELQAIYHDQCPSIPVVQPLGRHCERDWVQGWYYNPAYPGYYAYHLWKAWTGDINLDGAVDVFDKVIVGAAFGATYNATDGMYWHQPPDFPGSCPYCPHPPIADANNDGLVDIYDKVMVGAHFGEGM